MGCGEELMTEGEVTCRRCRRGAKESRRETPGWKRATNPFKDGKTLNTCAGCFELNLDPEAAEIYCNSCKDMLLRRVAKEKNSRIEESSSWRTTGLVVEDPKASQINNTFDSSTTNRSTNKRSNAVLLKSRLSTTPNSHRKLQDCQSQADCMADGNSSDWSGEPYPDPTSIILTPTKWAFQPCVSCQTNSLLCDHSLPCCTQCKNTDTKCSYRYLTNPGRTKPIRFDEVPRICFRCSQPNTSIQISGLCQPCDDLRAKSAKKTSTSASNCTGTSSSSQIEESKSELPRFLASLNTRLGDIRLKHYSQDPHTQAIPMPKPQMNPGLEIEPVQMSLIPLPPVISSENIPLPGFTTPCLACLDQLISCALHPKPSPHLPSSMKPYTHLSIRSTPSKPQDPAAAIPCLACFDGETTCAHHNTSGKDAKVAQACGSCRLADLECDELKPSCGGCKERGVECLYIKGSAEDGEDDASETLLSLPDSSSETPPIPRACGGCRIAEVVCDETRPGCMVCKEKGLECMYINGGIPPFHKPTVLPSIPEVEDDHSQVTHNTRLTNSVILHPVSEEVSGDSMTDVRESQLDDSVILAASSEGDDFEDEYEEEAVNATDEGAQTEEPESEDWDVVSSNDEYEIIDSGSGIESDDGDSVVL
ncbi:hypothetical protein DL95DRAFT_396989 [Leptodontidium sp. 2 PMI_412]|nr:hypothetical protein DL95DRAFT_396989 [Leptodontidium sp. 2 PMI_412]